MSPLRRRAVPTTLVLALLALSIRAGTEEPTIPREGTEDGEVPVEIQVEIQVAAEVVQRVREGFYDPQRARAWATLHRDLGRRAGSPEEVTRQIRDALAELEASHTSYHLPGDPGHTALGAIFDRLLYPERAEEGDPGTPPAATWQSSPLRPSLGLGLTRLSPAPGDGGHPGGWFVARVFAGGPAEGSGLLRGDRLVSLDGAPFDPRRLLGWTEGEVELTFERSPGDLRTVHLEPRRVHPREEWLADQRGSARVVEVSPGARVGVVALWSCAGLEPLDALRETLLGPDSPLAAVDTADAVVLDLRGGWGGCNPEMLHLFDRASPDLTFIDRQGEVRRWRSSFKGELVVLVDGGSRSGKELVARAVQRSGRGRVVGETTAGAVLAGRPYRLSNGAFLYLAVEDVRVDGERLEGIGVRPDRPAPGSLPWAAGRDPQLDEALEAAAERVYPSNEAQGW